MYTPFKGPRPSVPQPPKQLSVMWRMQGPRSVLVAAIYEHPIGRELRVYFEHTEDNVLQTQVAALPSRSEGRAAARGVAGAGLDADRSQAAAHLLIHLR